MKNRNNDRSDASLQVNHLGDVHGSRPGARPPIREAITKMYTYHLDRAPLLVTKTLSPLCIIKKKQEFLKKRLQKGETETKYDNPGALISLVPLFFYRHLNPINGIGGQEWHFEFGFRITDKISHHFSFICPGQFE